MNNTSELKKYYIKMIHTLKYNYFVDDECKKIYLQNTYGKDSLTKLNISELREVLELCGYKKQKSAIKKSKQSNFIDDTTPRGTGFATKKQLKTILGIWNEVSRENTSLALRNFIYRVIKKRPLYINSLHTLDASKVVRALMQMKENYAK